MGRLLPVLLLLWPGAALAHAGQQSLVLLLLTEIFIFAGTSAVLLSMVLAGFLSPDQTRRLFQPVTLVRWRHPPRLFWGPLLALCAVLIWLGFAGSRGPLENLLPLSFWTLFWIGGLTLAALVAPLLPAPGPRPPSLPRHDTPGPVLWPGLAWFLLLGLFANVDPAPSDPDRLAWVLSAYAVLCAGIAGALGLGWLRRHGEVLSLLVRLLGSLAPVQLRGGLRIGLPGWAALARGVPHVSAAVWAVLFLGLGSFDGLKDSFYWLALLGVNPLEYPGASALVVPNLIGFALFNLGLLALVWLVCRLGIALAGPGRALPPSRVFAAFGLTFLPIAVGYHAAHYLISFRIDVQYLPLALSDPLGRGADWLHLGARQVTAGFLGTTTGVLITWLTQAGLVVLSHLIAVLMAHRAACRLAGSHGRAIRLQIPLSLMMIAYTWFGLWLLATPRGV